MQISQQSNTLSHLSHASAAFMTSLAESKWLCFCNFQTLIFKTLHHKILYTIKVVHLEHKPNDWVHSNTNFLVCPQEPLLATVKKAETCGIWACHTSRQPLQNHPSGHLGRWVMPWSEECWMDNIKKWTSLPMLELLTMASCRKDWKRITAESSFPLDELFGQRTELN